jgi:hypothetical protein
MKRGYCGMVRHGSPRGFAAAVLCALSTVLPSTAAAQDRPSEAEMFEAPSKPAATTPTASGTPSTAPPTPTTTPADTQTTAATPTNESARDTQILGSNQAAPMFTEEAAPDDPLRIGGQLYLRMQSTATQGQRFQNFSLSSPSLLDVYLDARPNDRVRAFVRGRMLYDPTLPASANSGNSISAVPATGSTSGSQSLSSLFQTQTRDPKVYLDQMWVNFDLWRRIFVTAGKQHVRWGTGHFWAPTDYLHVRPRNPLDVFDARTGTTMVKLHVPIESRQWNFYAYGVTEGPDATQSLGKLAAAARAEIVLGSTEIGLGFFARQGRKAKLAADLSTGIGDFDLYGELALRSRDDVDRVRYDPNATIPTPTTPPPWQNPNDADNAYKARIVDAVYPVYRDYGVRPQAVGGITYSRKYHDNDMFTVGAEYFYNGFGYSSPTAYPGLVLPHSQSLSDSANFFYLGRHYAAIYATFPAPYSLDNHTFTLSTLGNLSDSSYITRLDYSFILLTHVRFEAFVSGRYGNENGEFRFGVKHLNVGTISISRPPAFMDFGMALRVAI